ncbi:MAG TPA: fructose-6-phosphate aldolase [Clostridiales bacterium]|jgi:transaldolase|nr:fructose-6-phosphate aldolase [Clostridiales bacterium]
MKLFIDTANIDEIKEIAAWGVLTGVTTNPSLIAKEGRDFKTVVKEITELVGGSISAEVLSDDTAGMVREAVELASIHPNVTIKVPMTGPGLAAVAELSKKGIKTNVTLVFSANQALLAAAAGASYVSPFIGRMDDMGNSGIVLVEEIAEIFQIHDIETEIIAASIRTPANVIDCARAGAHIATIPYAVLKKMIRHPLTDAGIERFKKDWAAAEKA